MWYYCPMEQMQMTTGEALLVLRKRAGKSVEETGNAIGYSGSTIHRWESGKVDPPLAGVRELVRYLCADDGNFGELWQFLGAIQKTGNTSCLQRLAGVAA